MKSNWKLRSKQHEDRIRGEMFDTGSPEIYCKC